MLNCFDIDEIHKFIEFTEYLTILGSTSHFPLPNLLVYSKNTQLKLHFLSRIIHTLHFLQYTSLHNFDQQGLNIKRFVMKTRYNQIKNILSLFNLCVD